MDVTDLASINLAASDEASRQALINQRFETESGTVAISGIDALLRIMVDQINADSLAGRSSAALLSGYRGSPLGGVDIAYSRAKRQLLNKSIHFLDSINEELAATSIWGSQLSTAMNGALFDGVLGMWYGKAPGLDRAGDALRHANLSGADPKGGVLCVAGDDPECKSSTIPSASEGVLADLNMPVLYPGSVQEVMDYGRYGYELSRASGLWSGFKIVTDIADAYTTADVGPSRMIFSENKFEVDGNIFVPTRNDNLLPPYSTQLEEELFRYRLPAIDWFIRENPLYQNTGAANTDAWLGIVAAGKTFYDLLEALEALGLDEYELERKGIRIHKPGVIWPLDEAALQEFARGLEKVLVIEEKRDLLETQVKKALYSMADRPIVLSRKDENGKVLIPNWGSFTPDILTAPLVRLLGERISLPGTDEGRLELELGEEFPDRIPYYCSGCPHNRSTVVPEGSVAGGGIGCHTMSLFMPERKAEGVTQMGGEGAQWVGASKFVETKHRFQNMGDGTWWHSGSLAIRQSLATNTNITYKILYNDAVAMTGGQEAPGILGVPELTLQLRAEGVQEIVVVADDVDKYPKKTSWPSGVEVKERSELDEVQRRLREVPGVSVLIYDQACSAETRRRRKRGKIPMPDRKIYINESICEDCGDCSRISNCLSLFHVETSLGTKVQVHQESCNTDLTCMEGNCPSFISVSSPERKTKNPLIKKLDFDIPEPKLIPSSANIMSVGIGGTGVLTANQITATAAFLDGKYVSAMDQTGLSQKGGTVASHLKVSDTPIRASNRIGAGKASAILMFDILAGVKILSKANPQNTVVVGSTSQVPTGKMILDRSLKFPKEDEFQGHIEASTNAEENYWMDADRIAVQIFKSQQASNVIVLGAAFQKGLIPASAKSLEKAIRLNGVEVSTNLSAFRLGRKLIADPKYLKKIMESNTSGKKLKQKEQIPLAKQDLETITEDLKKRLTKYQSSFYARAYVDFLEEVKEREAELGEGQEISKAVAIQLYRLMAYKDEYEVARLSLSRTFKRDLVNTFGKRPAVTFHLQPPAFSRLGLKKKLALPGRLAKPIFRTLTWAKFLRGSVLDPFGYSKERRLERQLIEDYRELISEVLETIRPGQPAIYKKLVEIAELPAVIKGFDSVKLANVERYRQELKQKLIELSSLEKLETEVEL